MKKTLIGFLASLGCLACLAGCGADSGLANAKDYIKDLYKNASAETGADFERAGFVKINGVDYTVEWSVNVTEGVTVSKNDAGDYVIDVNENAEAAIPYVLTATIKDAKGNTETLTYNYTVPKFRELTWAEFTAAADDTAVVIKGVIGGIVNTSNKHELYLQDADGGYYVYDLPVAEMEGLAIGTEIRVRGTRDTYYGVNQVVDADVEILNATPVDVVAEDVTEAFINAESTKDASLVALQSKLIKISGATVLGQDKGDASYFNFKIGDKKTYVRLSSSACMFGTEDQEAFKAAVEANIGMTADVTGFISVYNNAVYIIPQTKDAFSNFQKLNLMDAEKIVFEKDLMAGVASKLTSTVSLQTKGMIYDDVTISWASSNEAVAKVESGKLVVTRPAKDAADVTITVTATISCGTETPATVEYEVLIPKMPSTVPAAITAAPVVGTTYKMYMNHTGLNKELYLIGVMDGYYIATTEAQEEAANVTVNKGSKDNTFALYVSGAGYLNITVAEKTAGDPSKGYYYNISFGRDATTDWVWDDTYKTLVTDEADEARRCFLGTQANKTFTTISSSAYKYISSNVHANLCTFVDASDVPGTDEPAEPEVQIPAADSEITIAQALAIGKTFAKDAYTEGKYYVTGTIKSFESPYYGNMTITDGTNDLTIYGSYDSTGETKFYAMTEGKPAIGDTVKFYGIIGMYNAPQMKNAWIMEVTPGTAAKATAPQEGTSYYLFSTKNPASYVQGKSSNGEYMAVGAKETAITITFEAVEGVANGYYIKLSTGDYVNAASSGNKLSFSTTASTVWIVDTDTLCIMQSGALEYCMQFNNNSNQERISRYKGTQNGIWFEAVGA